MLSLVVQIQHSRSGNCKWKVQQAGFGRQQKLSLESITSLGAGDTLSMDFGADKIDTQILLDYGILDSASPQVTTAANLAGYHSTLSELKPCVQVENFRHLLERLKPYSLWQLTQHEIWRSAMQLLPACTHA